MWIEILVASPRPTDNLVTPFAGVWIEIGTSKTIIVVIGSLPSRECGLKYRACYRRSTGSKSLPSRECGLKLCVNIENARRKQSLPSRECGLKSEDFVTV